MGDLMARDDPRQFPLVEQPNKPSPSAQIMPEKIAAGAGGSPRGAAVWTNVIAALLMAVLLGAGAFVSSRVILIDDQVYNWEGSRNLRQFSWGLYIPAQPWNIGVSLIGTAIGIIASLAFSVQDDFMTRRALASGEGCPAMFLRPLTAKRGVQQLFRGMLSPERTLLFLLTAATAIMSAATIAVFSIQQSSLVVLDPRPSYPLQDFNTSFFVEGIGFYSPAGSLGTGSGALGQFAYKSAYIDALIAKGYYDRRFQNTGSPDLEYIAEAGQIGFTAYSNLSTGGIGLNVASYSHRSGNPVNFALPPGPLYTLEKLQGDVYGTRIEVTCADATDAYVVADGSTANVEARFVSKPGGPNVTVVWDAGFGKSYRSLSIGTAVWGVESEESHPTLTLAISNDVGSVWVAECTYGGYEYLTELTFDSNTGYMQAGPEEKARLSDIGPKFKQDVVNATDWVLQQGMGGQLARGWIDAQFTYNSPDTEGLPPLLGKFLSQVGEAYVSLRRQNYEFTGANPSPSLLQADNMSFLSIHIRVQRMGGASYGWLAVYVVFFLGCLLGLTRIYSRARTVSFEAQDAVKLLANVYDPEVKGRTRLRYEEGLTIVGR